MVLQTSQLILTELRYIYTWQWNVTNRILRF